MVELNSVAPAPNTIFNCPLTPFSQNPLIIFHYFLFTTMFLRDTLTQEMCIRDRFKR